MVNSQVQYPLQVMKKWVMQEAQEMTIVWNVTADQYNWMLQILYFGIFVCKNQTFCLIWTYLLEIGTMKGLWKTYHTFLEKERNINLKKSST